MQGGDGGTERFYLATYREMVRLPSARAGYGRFYRTLADADARAALVHCTTGKDRTGWAAARAVLLLLIQKLMPSKQKPRNCAMGCSKFWVSSTNR